MAYDRNSSSDHTNILFSEVQIGERFEFSVGDHVLGGMTLSPWLKINSSQYSLGEGYSPKSFTDRDLANFSHCSVRKDRYVEDVTYTQAVTPEDDTLTDPRRGRTLRGERDRLILPIVAITCGHCGEEKEYTLNQGTDGDTYWAFPPTACHVCSELIQFGIKLTF